eukprot:COSAG06_NODE_4676_length_4043_cov_6.020039_5_plen_98_part_00
MRNLKLNSVATVDLSCCFWVLVLHYQQVKRSSPAAVALKDGRVLVAGAFFLFLELSWTTKKPQQHPIVAAVLRFNSFQFVSIRFNSLSARVCLHRGI